MSRTMVCLLVIAMMRTFSLAAQEETLTNVIAEREELTLFAEALAASDLAEALDAADSEFTLFVPDDAAFESALDEAGLTIDDIIADVDVLNELVSYYIIETSLPENALALIEAVETIQGETLTFTSSDDGLLINETALLVETIEINDNYLHVINQVLVPSSLNPTCIIQATSPDTVRIRVGPGNNRTSIAFLPANVEYVVEGQTTDSQENVWYRVDKDLAAPGKLINEAWVAASDVETSGSCAIVKQVTGPSIIPQGGSNGFIVQSSASSWVNSGIMLNAGQTVSISASGSVNLWDECEMLAPDYGLPLSTCPELIVGPDGFQGVAHPDYPIQNQLMPMSDAGYGALLGRIGSSQTFQIGTQATVTAEESGPLYFLVNEWIYTDNAGSFTVTVSIE